MSCDGDAIADRLSAEKGTDVSEYKA